MPSVLSRFVLLGAGSAGLALVSACGDELIPPFEAKLECAPEPVRVGQLLKFRATAKRDNSVTMLKVGWLARDFVGAKLQTEFGELDHSGDVSFPDSEAVVADDNSLTLLAAPVFGKFRVTAHFKAMRIDHHDGEIDLTKECRYELSDSSDGCVRAGQALPDPEVDLCCEGSAPFERESGDVFCKACAREGQSVDGAADIECCDGLEANDDLLCELKVSCADRYEITEAGVGPHDGSGLVTQKSTGLVWSQYDYDAATYDDAVAFCAADDARLPTKDEAIAIANTNTDDGSGKNCPWPAGWYTFTSTPGSSADLVWYVQGGGTMSQESKTTYAFPYYVLCVRDA